MKSMLNYELVCAICERDKSSKLITASKQAGATGGTIINAYSTVHHKFLNMMGIENDRKSLFISVMDNESEAMFYDLLKNKFKFHKGHGIAFTLSLNRLIGLHQKPICWTDQERNIDMEALFVVVEQGNAYDIMKTAREAGATGGTVIHGRGSGTHEQFKLFDMDIEPEKEILLIITSSDLCPVIMEAIKERHSIDEPGGGIMFSLEALRTLGIRE